MYNTTFKVKRAPESHAAMFIPHEQTKILADFMQGCYEILDKNPDNGYPQDLSEKHQEIFNKLLYNAVQKKSSIVVSNEECVLTLNFIHDMKDICPEMYTGRVEILDDLFGQFYNLHASLEVL